ncbi:hypothetical protein YTPLAS18_23990 [Nitrospira sp.]|nr:hypothetical protein YTPLAS18_23990 [Nitrospira sp.]
MTVPPWAENDSALGLTVKSGAGWGAATTVSVTGTESGPFAAPDELSVIMPVYVPAARPVMFTDTETDCVPDPDDVLGFNHAALSASVHAGVVPPVLEMVSN